MDLAAPLICDLLFVFFAISIFSYRKWPVLGLELPIHYIAIYIVFKLIGFHYVSDLAGPGTDDFSGDSVVTIALLFEAAIPLAKFANMVTLNHFHLSSAPSENLLYSSFAFDYLFFLLLSFIKRRRKAKKAALRRKPPTPFTS
jgi:hypothetical protein